MESKTSQTQAEPINAAELETSATDLVLMVENGEGAGLSARIQTLSQRDFIAVSRAIQTVEKALSNYALSWKGSEYWGYGEDYPDEAKASAASA
jgi:hypothetical protein